MPTGGSLHIGLADRSIKDAPPRELTPAAYIVIAVTDTGIGMDDATLARAFEPFFTTKGAGVGTGLGLPTVQGFVAQSGGTVRLTSVLGHGTTVELWLPRVKPLPVSIEEAAASHRC